MDKDDLILITGAGGFIGGHLVADFINKGFKKIRAVDIKPFEDWYQLFPSIENVQADLKDQFLCEKVCKGARWVFNLAADMGGMGFIESNKALCMLSVLVNTHMLLAAQKFEVERYFFSSSACVYAAEKQKKTAVSPLKEEDAYPAEPEDGYGWEKLFSERMCRHFREDFGLETRIARYHNVYGPNGTYENGREKAPAAMCRKIAYALITKTDEIEIWGDGEQTRSFAYIDDCIYGTKKIMESEILEPINLGSSELVSINELVNIIEEIAGIKVKRTYILDAPQGVRGRNSDNTLIKQKLDWEPSISLREGLEKTFNWIFKEMETRVAQGLVL